MILKNLNNYSLGSGALSLLHCYSVRLQPACPSGANQHPLSICGFALPGLLFLFPPCTQGHQKSLLIALCFSTHWRFLALSAAACQPCHGTNTVLLSCPLVQCSTADTTSWAAGAWGVSSSFKLVRWLQHCTCSWRLKLPEFLDIVCILSWDQWILVKSWIYFSNYCIRTCPGTLPCLHENFEFWPRLSSWLSWPCSSFP